MTDEEYNKFNYPDFVANLLAPSPSDSDSLLGDILHSVVGISGEAGELLDHMKKVVWQHHKLDCDYILKELGDVLFYFQSMCNCIGTDIDEVRKLNIEKLTKRYPGGVFDKNKSMNREEYK